MKKHAKSADHEGKLRTPLPSAYPSLFNSAFLEYIFSLLCGSVFGKKYKNEMKLLERQNITDETT